MTNLVTFYDRVTDLVHKSLCVLLLGETSGGSLKIKIFVSTNLFFKSEEPITGILWWFTILKSSYNWWILTLMEPEFAVTENNREEETVKNKLH